MLLKFKFTQLLIFFFYLFYKINLYFLDDAIESIFNLYDKYINIVSFLSRDRATIFKIIIVRAIKKIKQFEIQRSRNSRFQREI